MTVSAVAPARAALPAYYSHPAAQATLPLKAGVAASGPRWMFIAGGGVLGGLLFGLPGAVGGAAAGWFLTR